MSNCLFCEQALPPLDPPVPAGGRRAYDPWRGRLWDVCPSCARWNPIPLSLRWEILEECEEVASARGQMRLSTEQLALIRVDDGELIRVKSPARPDFVGWRYGSRLPAPVRVAGIWERLLGKLPAPPVGGYDPYGFLPVGEEQAWFASPFLNRAALLTAAFARVPFAPDCPSCHRPMAIFPWDLQDVELLTRGRDVRVRTRCALCLDEVVAPIAKVRPALRLGLALVEDPGSVRAVAEAAAHEIEVIGGAGAFVRSLARDRATLGELGSLERVGLSVVLDEEAEAEALEAEWQEAEEIAAIMDGELTEVPGFDVFRNRILGGP